MAALSPRPYLFGTAERMPKTSFEENVRTNA
jgi:hypothetical protein